MSPAIETPPGVDAIVATGLTKTFGEGQTFTVKVTKPGVIHYECTIHPATMNGTIDVVK